MMLEWLGENDGARSIRRATERALAAGSLTPDVGGRLDTAAMTQAIVNQLE